MKAGLCLCCFMRVSRKFRQRVQVHPSQISSDVGCFFVVPNLFYRSRMVYFNEKYDFQVSRGGLTFSRGGGGGSTFQGVGVQLLIPSRNHLVSFQGSPDPLPPPLWIHICACTQQNYFHDMAEINIYRSKSKFYLKCQFPSKRVSMVEISFSAFMTKMGCYRALHVIRVCIVYHQKASSHEI